MVFGYQFQLQEEECYYSEIEYVYRQEHKKVVEYEGLP